MSDEIEDKLAEAQEHLAEASDHIARAVEEIAVQERVVSKAGGEDRAAQNAEWLLRTRKDRLAVMYKHLATIQADLGSVVVTTCAGRAEESLEAARIGWPLRRVA